MTFCCNNVYQVLCKNPDLSVLKSLVDLADLKSKFMNLQCSTLFAPTNKAFQNSPPELLAYLTDPINRSLLKNVLCYHLTNKPYTTSELQASMSLTMANKVSLGILRALYYDWVVVLLDETQDRSDVVEGNIATKCNNYVHKINGLLLPQKIYYPQTLNRRPEPGTY